MAATTEANYFDEIHEQGYLLLHGFFSDADLGPIWRDIDHLVEAFCRQAELPCPAVDARQRDRRVAGIINQRPDLQSDLYERLQQLPALLALANHPKIRALAETILTTEKIGVWPRIQMRMDLYQDEFNRIAWHTDYMYNQGTDDSFTFWMPLVNVEPDMGLLRIAPRSHHIADQFEFCKIDSTNRFAYTLKDEDVNCLEIETPQSDRAGDLVVFHSKVIHCGAINFNPHRARLTALFRMQNLNSLEVFRKTAA